MKSPTKRREGVRRNLDRYTLVSWGSPASHTDKFKKGGTWSKRRKIHKLDRSRFALWAKIAELDMKESEEHVKERSVMAQLKEEAKEFEKAQEEENEYAKKIDAMGIELENLDVEIGDNFSGSLNRLVDVASQKNSTTTTEDGNTTKSEKLSKEDCEKKLDDLRTKRRRIGQRVRELKHEHAALIRQLEHIRAQRENMQNQVHSITVTLQSEILNTVTSRHGNVSLFDCNNGLSDARTRTRVEAE